jgi:hypothetical protein
MKPGGPVQQPYSYSVPIAPIDCFKIPTLVSASSDTRESWAADEAILNKIKKTRLE